MSKTVCLLIHGIAGGQYQMKKLKDYLNAHQITAVSISLKGHDRTRPELKASKYYEWLADAKTQYKKLANNYQNIIVIGFSMGGLIALNLARRYQPLALVLVNCPIRYVNLPLVSRNIISDLKTHDYKNIKRYTSPDGIPVKTFFQFVRLLDYTKPQLRQIYSPVFIAQFSDDDVVLPISGDYLLEHLGSREKTLKKYKKGGHHIFLEDIETTLYEDIAEFVCQKTELRLEN